MTRELDTREYEVSIVGGYDDENRTSEDITETLLSVMQVKLIVLIMIICIDVHFIGSECQIQISDSMYWKCQYYCEEWSSLAKSVWSWS